MDQDTMVSVNLAGGWRLIDALVGRNFPVDVAFWAKLSEEDRWVLYIASPYVDQKGPGESYRLIHAVLRDAPEWGIDAFTVTVVGAGNSMAKAAADLVKPKLATVAPTGPKPKSYHSITRYAGPSLGGQYIDGAFIYPPWESGINPVG